MLKRPILLKNYKTVLESLTACFIKGSVIFERARFNCQCQLPAAGELVEQYIVKLYNLVEHCNYGDLKSEMM